MYSAASKVFLLHLVPVVASVRWTLDLAPKTASSSELTCTVHVDLHPVLGVLARLMAGGMFLGRHVNEETDGFVADITPQTSPTRSSHDVDVDATDARTAGRWIAALRRDDDRTFRT